MTDAHDEANPQQGLLLGIEANLRDEEREKDRYKVRRQRHAELGKGNEGYIPSSGLVHDH